MVTLPPVLAILSPAETTASAPELTEAPAVIEIAPECNPALPPVDNRILPDAP